MTTAHADRAEIVSITVQLDGRFVAPRRFDAFEVPAFIARVTAEPGHLIVDCSEVEFLDLTAHQALISASRAGDVTILDPSGAMLLTCDLVRSVTRRRLGVAA